MSSYAIMTNVGRNKEAAALASGTSLSITEIAWGDGDRSPGGGETALLNEVGRKQVQGTGLVPDTLNTAFFEILLDANEGPFVIREAGLFDVDGDLIALAKYDPPVNKPKDTVTALVRINVVFSDLENLILNVQSTDAYVPVERKINAGTGLTGGGDMSDDRALAVAFATKAAAEAGTNTTKVMSPQRVDERFKHGGLIEKQLVLGAPIEAQTYAKLQVDGFIRSGSLLIYSHVGDDALQPLVPGSVKAFRNRGADNRLLWGSSPVWTDEDGARNFGLAGYEKLPSGWIWQWAWPTAANNGFCAFPIAFPNACRGVMLTENHPDGRISLAARDLTTTGYTLLAFDIYNNANLTANTQHMMLAYGY